jgi:hypothetical protein
MCFAPVIHTLCVAPSTEASHTFSHVMPDGQTMIMGDPRAPTVAHETAATSSTDGVTKPDNTLYLSLLGVVLVAGGIAVAVVACALACVRLARAPLAAARVIDQRWHPPPGRPRVTLSLNELSISRT